MGGKGGDVVVLTISRACCKELLLACTLALGGTPIKKITKGKKKGGKSGGGGGKDTSGGKVRVGSTGKSSLGKSASGGGKGRKR